MSIYREGNVITKPEEQARVHSRRRLVCLSQSPMG